MAERTAFVLSGGGAKGAYGLGVMRAILTGASPSTDHRAVDPEIFTGTSVGAFNATILASQPGVSCEAALDRLERIWRRRIADRPGTCGNGVFRLRGLPTQDLDLGCLFPTPERAAKLMEDSLYLSGDVAASAAKILTSRLPLNARLLEAADVAAFFDHGPLRALLADTIDFRGLARSGKELFVVASRWRQATPRIFHTEELVARRQTLPVLASMAIPGIFPQVWIDGAAYVDGGLSMNTPLKPAIQAGADVIHVVYLDPKLADAEPASASTFDVLARVFAILAAEQIRNDIRKADDVNRGLELLDKAERGEAFLARGLDTKALRAVANIATVARQSTARKSTGSTSSERSHRRVEIHRYRPGGGLARGADLLNFSIGHIDTLIRQGYDDAAHHDCEEAECSLFDSDVRSGVYGARFRSTIGERMTLR